MFGRLPALFCFRQKVFCDEFQPFQSAAKTHGLPDQLGIPVGDSQQARRAHYARLFGAIYCSKAISRSSVSATSRTFMPISKMARAAPNRVPWRTAFFRSPSL